MIRSAELGARGQQRAIAMIDLQTAQLHAAFGFLLVLGLAAWRPAPLTRSSDGLEPPAGR